MGDSKLSIGVSVHVGGLSLFVSPVIYWRPLQVALASCPSWDRLQPPATLNWINNRR